MHDRLLQHHPLVAFSARQHLKPQVRHFVGGLIAPHHLFRRRVGIARVPGRVVVVIAHRKNGALRQEDRLATWIHRLPVGIPVRNPDQRAARAAGKGRVTLQQVTQVVRVGIDRQQVHIERQPEIVADYEVAGPGRNAECAIVFKLNQYREFRLRLAGEVQSNRGLYQFRLAGRLQVNVQNQIVAWIETPCHAVGLNPRGASRLPEKEVAVGIERVAGDHQIHAGESFTRNFFRTPGGARAIHQQIGVMRGARMARANLNCLHVTGLAHGWRQHKVPEDIRTISPG